HRDGPRAGRPGLGAGGARRRQGRGRLRRGLRHVFARAVAPGHPVSGAAAIVAARDEAATVRDTLEAPSKGPGVERLVVVDDGWSDDTATLAMASGAQVVKGPGGSKGPALEAGLAAVDAPFYLLVDADTGATAAAAAPLLAAVIGGQADLAIG